jgi:hypothetical protein
MSDPNSNKQPCSSSSKTESLAAFFDDLQSLFFGSCACRSKEDVVMMKDDDFDAYQVDGNVFPTTLSLAEDEEDGGVSPAATQKQPPLVLEFAAQQEASRSKPSPSSSSDLSLEGVLRSLDTKPLHQYQHDDTMKTSSMDDEDLTTSSVEKDASISQQQHCQKLKLLSTANKILSVPPIETYQESMPNIRSSPYVSVSAAPRRVSPASSNDSSDDVPPPRSIIMQEQGQESLSTSTWQQHKFVRTPPRTSNFRNIHQQHHAVIVPPSPSTAATTTASTSLAGLYYTPSVASKRSGSSTDSGIDDDMNVSTEQSQEQDDAYSYHEMVPWE